MLKQFYPKEWTDSTYGIPWETWYGKGIRGVIFDVDNTLVPHVWNPSCHGNPHLPSVQQ